jgi:hypothetical protein
VKPLGVQRLHEPGRELELVVDVEDQAAHVRLACQIAYRRRYRGR